MVETAPGCDRVDSAEPRHRRRIARLAPAEAAHGRTVLAGDRPSWTAIFIPAGESVYPLAGSRAMKLRDLEILRDRVATKRKIQLPNGRTRTIGGPAAADMRVRHLSRTSPLSTAGIVCNMRSSKE